MSKKTLEQASHIRRNIIEMAYRAKSAHVGTALSCVDILSVLYGEVLQLNNWEQRDIFILSKAHGAMSLYACLAENGIIEKTLLEGYHMENGTLPAHLDSQALDGVEVSAGALGHGFNMGLGMGYGFKLRQEDRQVYIVIGDGETQEGSIWEGALFASQLELNNVTVFLDYNKIQGYGDTKDIASLEPIADKWCAFGWEVFEIDGHDHDAILSAAQKTSAKPKIIIANTVKGKGVSFMENTLDWHYFIVTDERRERALKELQ